MIENKDFVHLHCHSEYSQLDGLSRMPELVMEARKMGFPALALTDHGNVMGWIKFLKEARLTKDKKDNPIPYPTIKAILAGEFYLARHMNIGQYDSSLQKQGMPSKMQPDKRKGNRHLNLYALNFKGYQNLCMLSQESWRAGFYSDPRIDIEMLNNHSEGLMCGSACFLENQLVNTNKGLKKIIDLSLRDEIIGIDGICRNINVLTGRDYDGEIYTIKAKGHFGKIQCTADHKLYVYNKNNGEIKWEVASKVNKDYCLLSSSNNIFFKEYGNLWDYVIFEKSSKARYVKNINKNKVFMSEDLCYLLGLYLAEGSTGRYKSIIQWTFNIKEMNLAKDVQRILKNIFKLESTINERPLNNRVDVYCCSVELKSFIETFCGRMSNGKFINGVLKYSNEKCKVALLKGAFLGDGHFKRETKKNGNVRVKFIYASISKSLLTDLREMCISLGIIVSSIENDERISKKGLKHSRSYYLFSYGKDAEVINSLMESEDFLIPTERIYNKIYKFVYKDDLKFLAFPITSIEKEYKKTKVYCLNEPLTSSFHADGFIVHNCLSSVINVNLLYGNYDKAKEICGNFKEIFKDNFFLEVMYHGIPEEKAIIPDIFKLSTELDIPICASNDCHYVKKSQADSQEALMCMSTSRCIKDPKHISFPYKEFYLKSAQEMEVMFRDTPHVLYNTKIIADRVDTADIEKNLFGGMRLPKFDIPAFYLNSYDYLCYLGWEGLKEQGWDKSEKHIEALKKELTDIKVALDNNNYDFATYFLIVRDYIKAAEEKGVLTGGGRGSGYSSILLRCLGITYGVDPLEYGCLWERFLGFSDTRFIKESDFGFNIDKTENIIDNITDDIEEERELEDDLGGVDRY
jgi:intein/homing endonuclease